MLPSQWEPLSILSWSPCWDLEMHFLCRNPLWGSLGGCRVLAHTLGVGLTDSLLGDLTRLSSSASQKGPRSDSSKSNKIFVGGIPHNCGETELREYFKKFGVVSPGPAPLGGPRAAPCFPESPGMAGGRAGREWNWDWGLVCRHHPGASPSRLVVACFWGVAFSFQVS